jgi:hypothetical protein
LHALEAGRSPVVITERTAHLEVLAKRLERFARHVIVLRGGQSEKQRSETAARLPAPREAIEECVMTTPDENDLKAHMVDLANQHQENMRGATPKEALEYIKRTIDRATCVFGIYPDVTEPDGVGMDIIKGEREVQAVVASGYNQDMAATAIPCIDLEQAIAAKQALGDGLVKTN